MTFLFPVIAYFFPTAHRGKVFGGPFGVDAKGHGSGFSELSILIPAHNEEKTLPATLAGIRQALIFMKSVHPSFLGKIFVGADACTDGTAQVAVENGADTVQVLSNRNKWLTLRSLLSAADIGPWVAFADSAVLWPKDFLVKIEPYILDKQTLGLAPACYVNRAGLFGHLAWVTERKLKTIESFLGGPISIHGPTVIYRTAGLKNVIAELGDRLWLNDDVVIPLMYRALYPLGRLIYWTGKGPTEWVIDDGLGERRNDFVRRRRIMLGNLQWIRHLLCQIFGMNPRAGILAMRRVFRVFWLYWMLCFMTGLASLCLNESLTLISLVLLLILILIWHWAHPAKKGLRSLLMVSLLAPYYFWNTNTGKHLSGWK